MQRKINSKGFTLLEVIVSLVILTVALSAIITVGSTRAETLLELRERNRALLVANNILERYYLTQNVTTGVIDGKQENGQIDWYWQLTIAKTNNDNILRMDVKVSKDNDFDYAAAQLVGFK
ncbi:MAG: type II secretion system minor pseudopilin GspI [Proteobacteria bacterium]|nr:type II secretion system minor pseudopilin GspI [Pseudomonadota bacterium]